MKTQIRLSSALACMVLIAGCNVVLGLDDYQAPPDGVGCTSGSQVKCYYNGASNTEDVGMCRAGVQTCKADGSGYGPCEGEVLPAAAEDCSTPGDDDCDGTANEMDECSCKPGTSIDCYTGPTGTEGIGACKKGTQACKADGTGYEAECVGEVVPQTEDCKTVADDDCDGQASDDVGDGCMCQPGTMVSCYSGPTGTQGVGVCIAGMGTCAADGKAIEACNGEVTPAVADDCNMVGDEDCDGVGCSDHIFSAAYGNLAHQFVNNIATDPQGNIIMVGGFYGTLVFGADTLSEAGNGDMFIAKFAPDGTPLWGRRYGDAQGQTATAVATDSAGNIYVTGYYTGTVDFGIGSPFVSGANSEAFVLKLNGDGMTQWATKTYSTTRKYQPWSIAVDSQNRPVVAGWYTDTSDNQDAIYMQKISATGGVQWSKAIDSTIHQRATSIAIDASDNIYLVGYFQGVLTLATTMTAVGTADDIFMAKLDPFGTFAWSQRFGDGGTQRGTGIAIDHDGNVVIIGTNGGTTNFGTGNVTGLGAVMAKFDTAALPIAAKQFGGGASHVPNRIAIDSENNILVAGDFAGFINIGGQQVTSTGGTDMFVAKFDKSFNALWGKGFGNGANDEHRGFGVAAGLNDIVCVSGTGIGPVDFGGVPVNGGGNIEVYLAGFQP